MISVLHSTYLNHASIQYGIPFDMGMGRIQSFDVASGTQTVPSIVALNNA
jgi:hypothetical protein